MTEALSFLDSINSLPGIRASWVGRVPDLPLAVGRDEAMARLRGYHQQAIDTFAGEAAPVWCAEQVHGNRVEIVPYISFPETYENLSSVPHTDGLVTAQQGIVLSIHVADCGPIWLADRGTGAVGLLHSGKKGTEGDIFGMAIRKMTAAFGTRPQDVIAVLGPCIRPPDYEIDFAAEISRQASRAGVTAFHDCGLNTASDLESFYSYRKELGKTGRMMALITRDP